MYSYMEYFAVLLMLSISIVISCDMTSSTLYVPPLQATKALRVGRGVTLPNLRPRH